MTDAQIENFRRVFVLLLVIGISLLFGAMVWPFVKPLFLAAILSGLLFPVYRKLIKVFRGRRAPASIVTVLLLMLLILGPLSAFIGLITKQAVDIADQGVPWVKEQITSGNFSSEFDALIERTPKVVQDNLPTQEQFVDTLAGFANNIGNFLVKNVSKMTAGAAGFFLSLFVMLYAMFFFLIDGRKILDRILYLVPLPPEDENRMLEKFTSITRATLKGTLVIGIVQGTLGGIGFAVAGLNGAAFWGTMMMILSVIPALGTPLILIPGAIILMASGNVLAGVLLAIWAVVVVGMVDNILRPILVGKDTQMADLLVLLGTLGGLILFGAVGIIIGPIVCGLFLTIWDIYGETFKSALPKPRRKQHGRASTVKETARKKELPT